MLIYSFFAYIHHCPASANLCGAASLPFLYFSMGRKYEKYHFSANSANYLTDPVIPSANCFCRTKKTIMVGIEQNRTPIISMP